MNSLLPHLKIFRIKNKKEKRNLKQLGYDHGRKIGRRGEGGGHEVLACTMFKGQSVLNPAATFSQ